MTFCIDLVSYFIFWSDIWAKNPRAQIETILHIVAKFEVSRRHDYTVGTVPARYRKGPLSQIL